MTFAKCPGGGRRKEVYFRKVSAVFQHAIVRENLPRTLERDFTKLRKYFKE